MTDSRVCAVVGGQFGSEAKGHVVGHIAPHYQHHVRVGAANAGHTFYTGEGEGEKHVLQQLPIAAYANPEATLYIGPGAIVSLPILEREINTARAWRKRRSHPSLALIVDHRAHIVTQKHIATEKGTDLVDRIGSTSATAKEGIGVAQAERVLRSAGCRLVGECRGEMPDGVTIADVPYALAHLDGILLEGTQGLGLSLTTGEFPYVTSRNTSAAGLCADVGLAPRRLERVIVVLRTYPIRVAGNSGPFAAGSEEIRWEDIGVDEQDERTTVTRKVRRVATFSWAQAQEAVLYNGATEIALMFADYLDDDKADEMIRDLERRFQTPVSYAGYGPNEMLERDGRTLTIPIERTWGQHAV